MAGKKELIHRYVRADREAGDSTRTSGVGKKTGQKGTARRQVERPRSVEHPGGLAKGDESERSNTPRCERVRHDRRQVTPRNPCLSHRLSGRPRLEDGAAYTDRTQDVGAAHAYGNRVT